MDLRGNGTDLSKLYPSGGTNIGFSANTMTAHYMHVVPNSHFWGNLDMLLTHLGYIEDSGNQWYENAWKAEMKYLIIGLENTIKNGYNIKKISGIINLEPRLYFSVEDMINEIERADINPDYNTNEFLKDFIKTIQCTINMGYNLTNGLKMERTEVYKRIDGERDYQDLRWTPRRETNGTPDEQKPPAEWINYIEYHIAKAKEEVYMLNDEEALAHVRKVAALAVRCLELHGCPERVIPADLLVK